MSKLTLAEKEYWRKRIQKRIDRKIAIIEAEAPQLRPKIAKAAHTWAVKALGLTEYYKQIARIRTQRANLLQLHHKCNIAAAKKVLGDADNVDPYWNDRVVEIPREILHLVAQLQAQRKGELLAATARGRKIQALEEEREQLIDTVWLATSSVQIKTLWAAVNNLVGDNSTPLQQAAIATVAAVTRT